MPGDLGGFAAGSDGQSVLFELPAFPLPVQLMYLCIFISLENWELQTPT
jgi:hypothetical protein